MVSASPNFSEVLILRFSFQPVKLSLKTACPYTWCQPRNHPPSSYASVLVYVSLTPLSVSCGFSEALFLLLLIHKMFLPNHFRLFLNNCFICVTFESWKDKVQEDLPKKSSPLLNVLHRLTAHLRSNGHGASWLTIPEFLRAMPHSWSWLRKMWVLMLKDNPQPCGELRLAFLSFPPYHINPWYWRELWISCLNSKGADPGRPAPA